MVTKWGTTGSWERATEEKHGLARSGLRGGSSRVCFITPHAGLEPQPTKGKLKSPGTPPTCGYRTFTVEAGATPMSQLAKQSLRNKSEVTRLVCATARTKIRLLTSTPGACAKRFPVFFSLTELFPRGFLCGDLLHRTDKSRPARSGWDVKPPQIGLFLVFPSGRAPQALGDPQVSSRNTSSRFESHWPPAAGSYEFPCTQLLRQYRISLWPVLAPLRWGREAGVQKYFFASQRPVGGSRSPLCPPWCRLCSQPVPSPRQVHGHSSGPRDLSGRMSVFLAH